MQLNHSRLCFGLFYRPPNSDPAYFSGIEDSIYLAVDTQIRNITVTGDFNFNVLNEQSSRKITDLCEQFSLYQTITKPTHFIEHSSSLIDIILTSDKRILFIVVLQILFSIKKPVITALFLAFSSFLNTQENPSHAKFWVTTRAILTRWRQKFLILTGTHCLTQTLTSILAISQTI